MSDPGRARWLGRSMLVGMLYLAAAMATAALAGAAASARMRFAWRLSAFVVSGLVLAAHIADEHFRRREPARVTAWRASVAAPLARQSDARWDALPRGGDG